MEKSDRRFFMVECDSSVSQRKDKREYFDKVWQNINSKDCCKAAFDYFATLNIDKFSPRDMPETKFKNDIKKEQLNACVRFVIDYLGDLKHGGTVKMDEEIVEINT